MCSYSYSFLKSSHGSRHPTCLSQLTHFFDCILWARYGSYVVVSCVGCVVPAVMVGCGSGLPDCAVCIVARIVGLAFPAVVVGLSLCFSLHRCTRFRSMSW